jgi:hypothetical protein
MRHAALRILRPSTQEVNVDRRETRHRPVKHTKYDLHSGWVAGLLWRMLPKCPRSGLLELLGMFQMKVRSFLIRSRKGEQLRIAVKPAQKGQACGGSRPADVVIVTVCF